MRNPFAVAVSRGRSSTAPMPAGSGGIGGGGLVPVTLDKIPQWSDWSTRNAIQHGMKASSWVYICINRLMKAAASVPWAAEELHGDTWEPVEDHPLTALFERPNPFMPRQKLMEWIVSLLYLSGNSLVSKITVSRGGKRIPVELWPIWELDKIQPVASKENWLDRYDFRRDGAAIPILPDDVVHFMFPDPANPFWGTPPLKAASRVVDTDIEAVRWNKVMLQNRAVGDGVFAFSQMMSRESFDEAREMIREQYAGADNARLPWVLGSGATYNQMSRTPVEMDWLESRKFSREEIASVHGVPLPIIGVYENSGLGNDYLDTARRIFWADTIIPLLEDLKAGFNLSLTPAFGDPRTLRLNYDTSNVEALREDLAGKVTAFDTLVRRGIPINVAIKRLKLGIDAVPGGDVPLIDSTLMPLSMAGEGDPSGDPPPVL
jgi:HK97 family phage portal protein